MKPLICTIPYCKKDLESVKKLLEWIAYLGGCKNHCCLLAADSEVDKAERKAIRELANPSFHIVNSIPIAVPKGGFAPNHMFMLTAQQVMFSYKLPWLWLEPDAVPLKSGWLDALADEYEQSPKRLMGSIIEGDQANLPPLHLSGVSIYPTDIFTVYDAFPAIKNANVAWDMEVASTSVPRAKNSVQMQSFWGKRDLPPTFVVKKQAGTAYSENTLDLDFLRPDAVLFHRNKDGTLIDSLKRRLESVIAPAPTPAPSPVPTPEPIITPIPATISEPVKRKPGRPRKIVPATFTKTETLP